MDSVIYTFLISMVPVVELRGAIPAGVALGLDPLLAMVISDIGNLIPVPFVILFVRKVFRWMRSVSPRLERLVIRLEQKGLSKADKVRKYEALGLFLFVAIPLPGTGAWTGSLIAALLDIRLQRALPMISLGVLTAGAIITLLTIGAVQIL